MILKLLRFESEISLEPGRVATLEILNRRLYSRVVASLLSEQGEQALEPYALWEVNGKKKATRGALMVLSSLPAVPLADRMLLSKLYAKLSQALVEDVSRSVEVAQAAAHLEGLLLEQNIELWGTYRFGVEWDAAQMLKAFALRPETDSEEPLLDQLVSLFGLCADVGLQKPLVLVNAKSFFEPEDLSELASQAFFYGISLLLLESWADETKYDWEHKTLIDQWFLEN